MRRLLSAFLIFTALLALCIGVGAADSRFSDSASIQNTNEVMMLSDLGLLGGYTDGTFRPGNTITRAEIAKVMANIHTAYITAARAAKYSDDVPGWASSYVNYCVQKGILSGYSDGTFRANDNITGRELAKMLLIVVGYEPKQFTGANWAGAVDRKAKEVGIYDGYTRDLNLYISRDDACLLINNALQCKQVIGFDAAGQPIYVYDEMYNPKSLLETRFGVVLAVGVIEANAIADLRKDAAGPLAGNKIHVAGYVRDFKVSAEVAYNASILGRKMTLYVTRDYSQVLGMPMARSAETYSSFSGLEAINNLLEVAPDTMTEKTKIFENLKPSDVMCLEERGDGANAVIIDHESDGHVEYILVTRPIVPETPETKP